MTIQLTFVSYPIKVEMSSVLRVFRLKISARERKWRSLLEKRVFWHLFSSIRQNQLFVLLAMSSRITWWDPRCILKNSNNMSMPWGIVEEMTFNGSNMVVLDVLDITIAMYVLSSLSNSVIGSSIGRGLRCLDSGKSSTSEVIPWTVQVWSSSDSNHNLHSYNERADLHNLLIHRIPALDTSRSGSALYQLSLFWMDSPFDTALL